MGKNVLKAQSVALNVKNVIVFEREGHRSHAIILFISHEGQIRKKTNSHREVW